MLGLASISIRTQAQSTSLQTESPEVYKSPLFIDDVHCEGFEYDIQKISYLTDSEKELEKKIKLRKTCIETLSFFGVKLHDWISQEDLDNASILMKSSGYFETIDLWIKKSDLKNHVHLFIKIVDKPMQAHRLNLEASTYKGVSKTKGLDNKELLSNFDYSYNRKTGPSLLQSFSLGKSYVFDGSYEFNNGSYKLSPEVRDVYLAQMKVIDKSFHVASSVEINLLQQKFASIDNTSKSAFDFEIEGNFYTSHIFGLNNKMIYGVSFHYFNAQKYEDYFNENAMEKQHVVLAPGLFYQMELGSDDAYKVILSVEGNTVISKEDIHRFKTHIEFSKSLTSLNFMGSKFNFGGDTVEYKNYQSALGRSKINNRVDAHTYFNFLKDVKRDNKTDQFIYGFESNGLKGSGPISGSPLMTTVQDVDYFENSQFKVSYKTSINDIDINLGFGYGL